ncbi:MAG TPA: YbaB/EbfC family nucleoid-associated protein [Candidatus Limnocylindrales bacterium]|nr:YbaB/EbfC family nucleoid-associated protein [Candidatus Limnocylindrales bacterium]
MAEEPSMMQMLKQARGLQKQMKQIQKKVEKRDVSATAADGKIEVVCSGKLEIKRVLIDQSLLENPDKRQLQDQLVKAVNGAIAKAQNLMAAEMQKIAGDMGLPGGGEELGLGADEDDKDEAAGESTGGGRFRRWLGR